MGVQNRHALAFDEAVSELGEAFQKRFSAVPGPVKESVREIRLREGAPIKLTMGAAARYITDSGDLANSPAGCPPLARQDLETALYLLCDRAIHTHQRELAEGYVSLRGGHRAGIAGTAVYDGQGVLKSFRNVTSIVLRIARDYTGVSRSSLPLLFPDGLSGLLLAGAPGSGKTTLLRDIAVQLSSGALGPDLNLGLVDERGELSARGGFSEAFCLCDVIRGCKKGDGILSAVRSLSPDAVVCDELGSRADVEAVRWALGCGVSVITSIHASSPDELLSRPAGLLLLETGAFPRAAFLAGAGAPSVIKEVTRSDVLLESARRCSNRGELGRDGPYCLPPADPAALRA